MGENGERIKVKGRGRRTEYREDDRAEDREGDMVGASRARGWGGPGSGGDPQVDSATTLHRHLPLPLPPPLPRFLPPLWSARLCPRYNPPWSSEKDRRLARAQMRAQVGAVRWWMTRCSACFIHGTYSLIFVPVSSAPYLCPFYFLFLHHTCCAKSRTAYHRSPDTNPRCICFPPTTAPSLVTTPTALGPSFPSTRRWLSRPQGATLRLRGSTRVGRWCGWWRECCRPTSS